MKQSIFFISILILLTGCKDNPKKREKSTTTEIVGIEVDSIPAEQQESLIQVPIRDKFNEKYNGHYSYMKSDNGEKILSGEFQFAHIDSCAMYNQGTNEYDYTMIRVSKIQYSGSFNNGKKGGRFTEKLLFDDGIDRYSKWTVSIDYSDDNCSTGTFTGIFGYIMEETTYKFVQLDTCTFQFVVDKASELWPEEYGKRKNNL